MYTITFSTWSICSSDESSTYFVTINSEVYRIVVRQTGSEGHLDTVLADHERWLNNMRYDSTGAKMIDGGLELV